MKKMCKVNIGILRNLRTLHRSGKYSIEAKLVTWNGVQGVDIRWWNGADELGKGVFLNADAVRELRRALAEIPFGR